MRAAEATLSALWTSGLGQCGEATTIFGGLDQVPLIEQATRTEALAGVTAKLNSHVSLYAQGGYQFAMEQTYYGIRRNGAQGDIGLRYNW